MASTLRMRLSLGWRMGLALVVLSAVSVAVLVVVAVAVGVVAWLATLTIALGLAEFVLPMFDDQLAALFFLVSEHVVPVVAFFGLLFVPWLSLRSVRTELRHFRTELGTTGTPAADRHPEVAEMASRLAQQADIATPTVCIVNRTRPESYTIGGRSSGTIVLTRGLIRSLSDEQLPAVIAHEVSHLANGDSRVMGLGLIPLLVAEDLEPRPLSAYMAATDDDDTLDRMLVLANMLTLRVPVTAGWILLWGSTNVLQLCCQFVLSVLSRGREFAADRSAAELTGSPGALASALQELDDERGRPAQDGRTWKRSASALDILPQEESRWSWGPFRTHPSTETRIRRLEALARRTADSESG